MKIAMLNVGANTSDPGFRGPIFNDGSFKFIPISESEEIAEGFDIDTYKTLGLEDFVPPDKINIPVHNDPNFKSFTYGHARRVDDKKLKSLEAGDLLLFMATLDFKDIGGERKSWINPRWGGYIIGYFEIEYILNDDEFWKSDKAQQDFEDCPHYKRYDYGAALWIKGSENSELLSKAVPLSDRHESLQPNDFTANTFLVGQKDGPWYRWVYLINDEKIVDRVLEEVKEKE